MHTGSVASLMNAVTYGLKIGAALTAKKFRLTLVELSATRERKSAGELAIGRAHQRLQHFGGNWRGAGAGLIQRGDRKRHSNPERGRFENIDCGQKFFVVVDYAHTDDALEILIRTARELNPKGRIIYFIWLRRMERPH